MKRGAGKGSRNGAGRSARKNFRKTARPAAQNIIARPEPVEGRAPGSVPPDPAARIRKLRAEIRRHNRLYYDAARPEITDTEYDALLAELARLEAAHPELAAADSPTQRVGAREAARQPVTHAVPLLSLDNTYTPEELAAFDARVRQVVPAPAYVVEPKIDGVAVALSYRDGEFVSAATRGDGLVGEEVSANLRTIAGLPFSFRDPELGRGSLELRGEVYISRRRFARLVEEMTEAGVTPFANPRNTAAGTLKLLDEKETARRGLEIFIHTVAGRAEDHLALLARLRQLGFPVPPDLSRHATIEEIIAALPEREEKRHKYPFDTDGLVIKLDAAADREKLGERSRSPRWAIAYKFPPEIAKTRLASIELQVGRTGVITPVAKFAPVHLAGTTVTSATLHNEDEIRRLDVRVGDTVRVQKAGEIIPQVVGVVPARKRGRPFHMPDQCPECGKRARRPKGEARYRCTNRRCPAILRESLLHFGARGAMEIDGLGPAVVDALLAAKLVKDPADLYDLNLLQLATLPRLAAKSAGNLAAAIERSRARPLGRLVFALGLPGVGERTAEDLAAAFGSLDNLMAAGETELESVPEVGETLSQSIAAWFRKKENRALIEKLRLAGLEAFRAAAAPAAGDGPLSGKTVVITGALAGLDRRRAEELVRALGGRPSGSVSKKTGLLIAGDAPGSKLEKARSLGVEILSGEEFLRLAGASGK